MKGKVTHCQGKESVSYLRELNEVRSAGG